MLTLDLIPVRAYKGELRPRYLKLGDPELQELAERLIDCFQRHQGQPRHELESELSDLLGTGTAFLLHRGLAKLLRDRCLFEVESPMEPEELRLKVFAAAAAAHREVAGDAARSFDRQAVLAQCAAELEIAPEQLERGLYADLKDQQVLTHWKPCDGEWLLRRYNVALAQGVLLRAEEVVLELSPERPERYRALFQRIKFFQLMHRVRRQEEGGYKVVLDGPFSLFQSSQRYGLKMASFLPTLLHLEGWTLSATVRWGTRRVRRSFQLSPGRGVEPYSRTLPGQWLPEELRLLPAQLEELSEDWKVSTDGQLIDLGGEGVLVPDFVFRHQPSGLEINMEVLGYWRKGTVSNRLKLLRRHGPPNLLLALSKQLAGEQGEALEDLPTEVYIFRSAPLPRRVLRRLEQMRLEDQGKGKPSPGRSKKRRAPGKSRSKARRPAKGDSSRSQS